MTDRYEEAIALLMKLAQDPIIDGNARVAAVTTVLYATSPRQCEDAIPTPEGVNA